MGFDKKNIKMFSQSPSIEAIGPDDIGGAAEGPTSSKPSPVCSRPRTTLSTGSTTS